MCLEDYKGITGSREDKYFKPCVSAWGLWTAIGAVPRQGVPRGRFDQGTYATGGFL